MSTRIESILRTAGTLGVSAALFAALALTGARPAQANTTNCYLATSEAAHTLCFLDFGGYSLANGSTTAQAYPFTIKLPDGSLVSGTITNAGPAIGPAANNPTLGITTGIVPLPTLGTSHNGGSALGNYSATAVAAGDATSTTYEGGYLGVAGNPAFYNNNTVGPISLGNISIVDSTGASEGSTITVAAADAEITAAADYDGGVGGLYWSTTGGNLTEVQLLNQMSTTTSICTFTLNALTATCIAKTGQPDPGSAYILSSRLTAATQAFSVKTITSNVNGEGFAFAFALGTLHVSKIVNSRAGTDQFTVAIKHGTATAYSATTTGTTTGAASTVTAGGAAVPGIPYTLTDATTTGSNPISQYVSTVSCTNAKSGSATTLPASGTVTQSVTITPAIDDNITCAFTNTALTLTDTAGANQAVAPAQAVTDTFTLKNTSSIPGTFDVVQPTVVAADGTTLTPTGYTLNGGATTYATLAALQTAINAAGATAAGASITIGVKYSVPQADGASVTTTLASTIDSGTSVSAQATATETDTLPYATLTIVKTGTATSSPGGLIQYSVLVTNTGPSSANGALFSDPLPTGLVKTGTPTCTPNVAPPTTTCGTITTSTGNPPTISSTIATLPSGGSVTFTIYASAAAAGSYTNTATIEPPAGTGGPTSSSSRTTTVAQANGLSKTVRNVTTNEATGLTTDSAKPGDTLEYTLSFSNTTGINLTNFSVSDITPTNTTFLSATCGALPAGTTGCTITSPAVGATGTVTYTYSGTLNAGQTGIFTLRVKVN